MANPHYPYSRSLTPLYNRMPSWSIWEDPWTDMPPFSRLSDQHFGISPMMDDFFSHWQNWRRSNMHSGFHHAMPVAQQQSAVSTGFSEVSNDEKEFKVRLDVSHFSPDEITLKVIDNRIVIHAKHEEKQDEHGYIQREFKRQYLLPRECDAANVTSVLASDGVLTIRATKLALNSGERVIPITQETSSANL
ncbi:alpha-crystallin A chain isoform X1 [Octopus bimaculoides]|uniref:SHSP domain-containing protein n=1 Tax=Octopus bimaculoides TaxID=37653 RepID=A0A0L8G8Y7_OCTBM|nr:alpha-crystallin A chain isoform X1 [Octopus bimaculoides]|eukprot:XP_014783063.1 PREDICTED: alpha-crystallin A chain-like isoform X1 [Octopus bimaculoides]